MRYFLGLSGEHETLPLSELRAVLEVEGGSVVTADDNVAVVEAGSPEFARRLAFAHNVSELYFSCDRTEVLKNVDKTGFKVDGAFAVRAEGFPEIEGKIGFLIQKKTGAKVRLKKPDVTFFGALAGDFYFGKLLWDRDKKEFEERKVRYRPFFHPTSLHPKFARAMVNLARVKRGDVVLDPFCGTGGLLIEACLLGAKAIGSDFDRKMVEGTKKNLESYKSAIGGYEVHEWDVRKLSEYLPENSIDAVVTDPPYGRSASLGGEDKRTLYFLALSQIFRVLKKNGFVSIACPLEVLEFDSLARRAGFLIVEKHYQRIHKSLSRIFYVLRKNEPD